MRSWYVLDTAILGDCLGYETQFLFHSEKTDEICDGLRGHGLLFVTSGLE